jgi:hypothetical protein
LSRAVSRNVPSELGPLDGLGVTARRLAYKPVQSSISRKHCRATKTNVTAHEVERAQGVAGGDKFVPSGVNYSTSQIPDTRRIYPPDDHGNE